MAEVTEPSISHLQRDLAALESIKVQRKEITREELLELKILMAAVKNKVNELFGTKSKMELHVSEVSSSDLMRTFNAEKSARWAVTKSAVRIGTLSGAIHITDDSMPF